ncbi:Rpn family recombination-promoting nuclease/putative transposase [Mediterraneibacter faecis]|uniref:Rpn family recombination-promoting nuclease/putative transposase n=1 Tax=Mediterraneibacter faecis TaxID=592978 RepID=UPI001D096775|nr:Rpn family recombination-promoting nuclease/putative transposase [Mediterraneibacter faecis]MCB7328110.1 Rpn family recombination-promoting nuclease/putative transposase [Mediterraneibacter faecis]
MGKADVNVNIWLSEKKRFANLFNGVIYGGRQVILPEDLEEVNSVSSVSVKNRAGKTKNMKRYRDIIMKWRNQATLVLLANESQDKVHYAMPHKVMLYDGMDYETQIRNNWKNFNDRRKQNKKAGHPLEHLTAGEYLSRFRKKDRLIPIISLVFYYGSEPWDGPVDLYDMFQLEGTKEEKEILGNYLPNYKINLVDAERLEDVEKFSDDLQVILTMLRYRDSKEELTDYINENKKFFQNVDYETSQAMKAFLNMKQIPGEEEHKEEMVDMCKAIQEMYDDGVKDGIRQGVERGIAAVIRTCRNLNVSKEDTLNNIQREYELSKEDAEKYLETYWK